MILGMSCLYGQLHARELTYADCVSSVRSISDFHNTRERTHRDVPSRVSPRFLIIPSWILICGVNINMIIIGSVEDVWSEKHLGNAYSLWMYSVTCMYIRIRYTICKMEIRRFHMILKFHCSHVLEIYQEYSYFLLCNILLYIDCCT